MPGTLTAPAEAQARHGPQTMLCWRRQPGARPRAAVHQQSAAKHLERMGRDELHQPD